MYDSLLVQAYKAMENAYCPYSNFQVGAAVLTDTGEIFQGCNIENASYGLTVCAERTAIFAAIASGHKRIKALAVVTNAETIAYSCGACRQVISEFSNPDDPTTIITAIKNDFSVDTINDLLPRAFSLK